MAAVSNIREFDHGLDWMAPVECDEVGSASTTTTSTSARNVCLSNFYVSIIHWFLIVFIAKFWSKPLLGYNVVGEQLLAMY